MTPEDTIEAPLPAEVRLRETQRRLEQTGFVRVRELADRFGVSMVTVRTDLQVLEERQQAFRVHGGAVPFSSARGERPFEEVAEEHVAEKEAIGAAAAAMVDSGETIIIDVGTTAASLSRELVRRDDLRDLTVVTNGLKIALQLEAGHPHFTVIVSGGTLRPKQHSLVEPLAVELFQQLRVDTVFLGCNGLTLDAGVTNVNLPEAGVKRAMIEAAARCIVLADGSKLGVRALASVCGIDDVDVLITDRGADEGFLDELRDRGIEVIVA